MARVLVADDDGHIREVVRYALEKVGHQVIEAADGRAALRIVDEQAVDLVVLDIVMPEEDGLEVCRRIRAKAAIPIVFLTSRDEELDRVLGLEIGGDDYVTKPFSPRELVARIKAVLRRTQVAAPQQNKVIQHGALGLDIDRHECFWGQTPVELTVTEFTLLQTLAEAPGRVFQRGTLVDRVYGMDHCITDRTIDSHVRGIRRKLATAGAKGDPIETVYGLGYRWRDRR